MRRTLAWTVLRLWRAVLDVSDLLERVAVAITSASFEGDKQIHPVPIPGTGAPVDSDVMWTLDGATLSEMLREVEMGEKADIVYMEMVANAESVDTDD